MTQNISGHNTTKGTAEERGNTNSRAEGESRWRWTNKGCRERWGVRENAKGEQYGYISKIGFDHFVILSKSEEREEGAACQKEERCHDRGWSHQQRDKKDFPEGHWDQRWKLGIRWGLEYCFGGTKAWTGGRDERVPSRAIHCLREGRKSVIQEWSWPRTP